MDELMGHDRQTIIDRENSIRSEEAKHYENFLRWQFEHHGMLKSLFEVYLKKLWSLEEGSNLCPMTIAFEDFVDEGMACLDESEIERDTEAYSGWPYTDEEGE